MPLGNTRRSRVFSGTFLVEMASFMFLSQYRDTQTTFYLFYEITKVFSSFRDILKYDIQKPFIWIPITRLNFRPSIIFTGFGPAYVTRDPDVAKNIANSLTANGGGDCPELGMNGLYLALTHSLPNSDVFYFSDASAKDAHLASVVLSIALTKRCKIYFFISRTCSRRRKRQNLSRQALYESLATATGGQLLEFCKTNIDDIISLIRCPNVSEANSSSRLQ